MDELMDQPGTDQCETTLKVNTYEVVTSFRSVLVEGTSIIEEGSTLGNSKLTVRMGSLVVGVFHNPVCWYMKHRCEQC